MKKALSFFVQYTGRNWKKLIIGLIISNILLSVATTLESEAVRIGLAAISEKNGSGLIRTAVMAAGLTLLLLISKGAVSAFSINVVNGAQTALSQKLLNCLIRMEKKGSDQHPFGEVQTIILDNIHRSANAVSGLVTDFTAGLGLIVSAGIYMAVLEWRLMLCLIVYYAVVRLIIREVKKKLKKNTSEVMAAEVEGNNLLSSLLSNMIPLRLAENPAFFREKYEIAEKKIMWKTWKQFTWDNGQKDFIWAAAKVAEYLIIYAIGVLVLKDVPSQTLFSFIFASDIFNNGLYQFSFYWGNQARIEVYMESIKEFLKEDGEKTEEKLEIEEGFPIIFDHVSFAYKDKTILQDVNLTIQPGEKVLIRGGNGQGKSTFLKLIAGLYRPDKGTVYYGKMDTSGLSVETMSDEYAYISQNSHLLDGNVYQNMSLSEEVDQYKAKQLLNAFHIRVSGESFPDTMSAGEKQRLNITRDFYRKEKPVVLADEIFSNVDPENRNHIVQLFKEQFEKSTVCMITHDDIDYGFDRIFHVDGGKVWEDNPGRRVIM